MRAREIAHTIADRAAPLGVKRSWRPRTWPAPRVTPPRSSGFAPEVTRLFATADAAEGVQSFIERREARFQGR